MLTKTVIWVDKGGGVKGRSGCYFWCTNYNNYLPLYLTFIVCSLENEPHA